MRADLLRNLLLAISLGLAPLAAGCVSHMPLPSDVARAPIPYSGPPIPISIGILAVTNKTDKRATVLSELTRKSLANVLRASRVVLAVREVGPAANMAAARLSPLTKEVDILLATEIEDFDLYSTYMWWLLYAVLFMIPFAGTASTIAALLLGAPVASDHASLTLRVSAIESRTGRLLGTYRGTFSGFQSHTIYTRTRVDESFLSHPELIFQDACSDIILAIAQDRFWLRRFARP